MNPTKHQNDMGRYIIVDEKHKEDGYRREEMRQRMRGIRSEGFRNADYRKSEEDYDEGYRKGYEDGYRDHEEESMSRMKDFRGRSM